jgi:hypothetical protein
MIGPNPVFEFRDTMPLDKITVSASATATDLKSVHPDARLSPVDCKLVTTFTPVGSVSGN